MPCKTARAEAFLPSFIHLSEVVVGQARHECSVTVERRLIVPEKPFDLAEFLGGVNDHDSGGDKSRGGVKDERLIARIPARAYSKGVIESQFEVERGGTYVIDLIRGRNDAKSEGDILRIPLNVGIEATTSGIRMRPLA